MTGTVSASVAQPRGRSSMTLARRVEIASPRRLIAGDDAIDELGTLVAGLGSGTGNVLVVADRAIVELGIARRATAPLEEAGFDVELYGTVAAEPDLEAIQALEKVIRTRDYVSVVGIGGGSALDSAKLAAALPTNDGTLVEYVEGRPFESPTLPLVLVPTTAGTGAEGSRNSVVSHGGGKHVIGSEHLCPSIALLDPTLTVTAPPAVTAASGVDALCHAVEATLSTYANAFTRASSVAAMTMIPPALRRAYADGADLDARRVMLHASYLAGLALNAVTVLGHTMGYTIASRTKLGHGVTCAMSLPYCLAYNTPATRPMEEIAAAVGSGSEPLALWSRRLGDELGIPPSLAAVGIPETEVAAMTDECIERYPRPNNPIPFERERLVRLYSYFLAGDIETAQRDLAQQA